MSVPNRTFNAEFKYVSSFSPSPTGFFFVTAKLNVKKEWKNVYIYIFFWGGDYLFLMELLTLNSNM
jgi:hypothetical protein